MSDLQILATGTASAGGGILIIARLHGRIVATAGTAPGPASRLTTRPGERLSDLAARTRASAAEIEAIHETVTTHRPRQLDGEEPDQAQHWQAAGFVDAEVVAWLEAGVPWSTSAQQLRDAGLSPHDVVSEHEAGITLGLAFARGDVALARLLAPHGGDAP